MADGDRLKITLDTNCLINLFGQSETATSLQALSTLIRYGLSGQVEVAATTRVEEDISNDKNPERRAEMLRFLELLPIIGSIGRFDISKWDRGDVFSDERLERLHAECQQIVFPGLSKADKRYRNKINDIDHIVGHVLNRRDIFVTDDNGILRRREQLKNGPGVIVMLPAECLEYVDAIERRQMPRTFPSEGLNPEYHSPALKGRATFDYSNNNHSFALGEGHFFFETRWSSASTTAIHAYSDSPSISALALAKGASEISGVRDATAYDFSSRTRTPDVGQIVVWRNVNGLYAATKIVDVKYDGQNGDHDELTFDYVILTDGSIDFGRG